LYVIGTPIGNLQDISYRAVQILGQVDLILAEDTRHSRILLDHLHVKTPMQSYHDFKERAAIPALIRLLLDGRNLALISDAGTPLISDPGYPLVKAAHANGIRLVPVPGASALLTALSVSGLATDRFLFEGFLSGKAAARRKRLQELSVETRTMIFFEAPHRVLELMRDIGSIFGTERPVCLCRELTKLHETIYRDSCGRVLELLTADPQQQKGEFVVIVGGKQGPDMRDADEDSRIMRILLDHGISVKQASGIAAEITGTRKKTLYELALRISAE
jgi:16S rRNA (cytidine1402-2'-O)-methyltransferase